MRKLINFDFNSLPQELKETSVLKTTSDIESEKILYSIKFKDIDYFMQSKYFAITVQLVAEKSSLNAYTNIDIMKELDDYDWINFLFVYKNECLSTIEPFFSKTEMELEEAIKMFKMKKPALTKSLARDVLLNAYICKINNTTKLNIFTTKNGG
ncbi:MAG: hypothetical protein PHC62_00830 [Candidatus Izemoplasmatales bacterium]|nr:hypothetical protein [Candidatus Izemoplasmatales bacterium]